MRGVRFTKAELLLIRSLLSGVDSRAPGYRNALSSLTKLDESQTAIALPSVQPLERALITGANHKVIALLTGHARASRQAGSVLATEQEMLLVGEWIYRQNWLPGPLTILDVLNKWDSWLPKAKVTESPAPSKGFGNADTGPGTKNESSGLKNRRPAQGFR